MRMKRSAVAAAGLTALVVAALVVAALGVPGAASAGAQPPVPAGAIKHVLVIDLENEDYDASFGPDSPANSPHLVRCGSQGRLTVNGIERWTFRRARQCDPVETTK